MINVNFNFNLGIYRTFIASGKEDVYIEEGYAPLLEQLDLHPGIKSNLFIEGVTLQQIAKKRPDLIKIIKKGMKRKQIEVDTYTYNHPVLTLIPYEDCYKQIEEGIKINEEILEIRPKGFMLPEQAWDPSLPKILEDLGIEYIVMGAAVLLRDRPELTGTDIHKSFTLNGVFKSKVRGVCMDSPGVKGEPEYYVEGGIVQGPEQNVKELAAKAALLSKESKGGDGLIMVCKNDAEFIYESSLAAVHGNRDWGRGGFAEHMGQSIKDVCFKKARKMGEGWAVMEKMKEIKFVNLGEFVKKNKPAFDFTLRPSGRSDYREWLDGSEKVDYIWCEARNEIKCAEYTILLAGKMGLNIKKAEELLKEAWLMLLRAEISTGRRACAHPAGTATKVFTSMEDALTAKELAKKAANAVKKGA